MQTTTVDRMMNIARMHDEALEMMRLVRPICVKLAPIRRSWLLANRADGSLLTIHLCVEDFPEQYRIGIDRIYGFDILWCLSVLTTFHLEPLQ